MCQNQGINTPEVIISYREMTNAVKRVADFVRSVDKTVLCKNEQGECLVYANEIYYIESVDKKTFVHCKNDIFQSSARLFELEESLSSAGFVRISKSTILNIEYLKGVKTLANSKLEAMLTNGESVCVTRKYLKTIKEELLRGTK